ncbi:uncharacterized protein K452DRAFT_286669 [Aplosporella prunicola CBS 121167]|uniref:Phospholipase/carboxylesterase/thioesterase domain-containing protein n=1 Tax=Aplosporella prunicola CBS 121167 TaxID=1176127 RepID=A0A6A6BFU9_9PEZI|nr:uncharacterized protein K452DRAFT_286669 [Aplosporella prunicola CBS 121167]KAF2143040.1 hypothetical protein K452DRAFT_286669 [Aplosporella prunicola CBS 121167]
MATEEPHTVQPTSKHTHTIILLHGRDSTAATFASEFFESQASDSRFLPAIFPSIKWVFPATTPKFSARFKTDLSQWFDMWTTSDPEERKALQAAGLKESVSAISQLLRDEMRALPAARIFLAGISQGCAVAVHTLFGCEVRLAGLLGFCGWLPFQADVELITQANLARQQALEQVRNVFDPAPGGVAGLAAMETPVFLAHARDDEVVPVRNGRLLAESLGALGMAVEWKEYEDGGHWLSEPGGIDDVVAFIGANMYT